MSFERNSEDRDEFMMGALSPPIASSLSREAERAERRRSRRQSNPFVKNERAAPKASLRIRRNVNWGIQPEKPWLQEKPHRNERIGNWLVYAGIVLGFLAFCGFAVWGFFEDYDPPVCKLVDEDFRYSELDPSSWQREITANSHVGGFEWTTDSTDNAFVKDGRLHIRPTLTQSYPDGTAINLTETAGCSLVDSWCNMAQNSTGGTVINPVQSAKVTTRLNMTYGRVEIRAKFPKADWTWASFNLNPVDPKYGTFPAGGQIVMGQVRGNPVSYSQGGRDRMDSYIQLGPDAYVGLAESYGSQQYLKFTDFSEGYHTIGLEWTRQRIRTWLDDPVNTIMVIEPFKFKKGYWYDPRFRFDARYSQVPNLFNPWAIGYPDVSAPFNVDFALTIQVGVGGMNGIFSDNQPWLLTNGRDYAMKQFSDNIANITRDWPAGDDRDLIVESVRMRRQCKVDRYFKFPGADNGLGPG